MSARQDYKNEPKRLFSTGKFPVAGGWVIKAQASVSLPLADVHAFYRHGWQSWSFSGWLSPHSAFLFPPTDRFAVVLNEDVRYAARLPQASAHVGAASDADGKVLLLGALDLGGRVFLEQGYLRGEYEDGSGDWFLAEGDAASVFDAYARALAERYGTRQGPAPRVWCSWYSLYYFIHEALLLQVLRALGDLPFDVFQIDDGWQQAVGDWYPNREFSHGMDEMAGDIRATGRIAGLWLAPFLVHERSALFRAHPDWLLRDETGQPVLAAMNWGGKVYALDVTRPAVQDWLLALMSRVRRWGYEYLKLDFLYAAALPAKRYADMSREKAYRLGLEVLRQGMGDAFFLACGAPIIPSLGLCDAIRIGPDVAAYWVNPPYQNVSGWSAPGLKNAVRTSVHRLWLRPLVHLDPDVVYFRHRASRLTEEQKSLQRDLAWICGYRATSDLPWWLTSDEREALRYFWEYQPEIHRLDSYRFTLDGREVNFQSVLDLYPRPHYPRFLAKPLGFIQDALHLGVPAILASRRYR